MSTGTRTSAAPAPAPDLRRVVIDVDAIGTLALGELQELGELTGIPLDELRHRLRPPAGAPSPADIIAVALALAVVIERRQDPELTMADARRWDIQVVREEPGPKATGAHTRPRRARA
jgi:hypothetical protein